MIEHRTAPYWWPHIEGPGARTRADYVAARAKAVTARRAVALAVAHPKSYGAWTVQSVIGGAAHAALHAGRDIFTEAGVPLLTAGETAWIGRIPVDAATTLWFLAAEVLGECRAKFAIQDAAEDFVRDGLA